MTFSKKTFTLDESLRRGPIRVTAEPLTIELDEEALSKAPAVAIAGAVGKAITNIATPASKETVARRRRDGSTSRHLFLASGTLARGVDAVPSPQRDGYLVVAPPDRLARDAVADRLRRAIPVIADDPTKDPAVAAALDKADASIVRKGRRRP